MNDIVTNIGNSILQHGKYNDRIYLMKLSKQDFPSILDKLDNLALTEKYSKIIAKVPSYAKEEFIKKGYIIEAFIPKFYNGCEDVYFMGKYFIDSRRHGSEKDEEILKAVSLKAVERGTVSHIYGFSYKICEKTNAPQMAEVYRTVFETYPFPIHDPRYIMKTMNENFIYFSAWKDNKIVALCSAEMDLCFQNAEMTDFATMPEYRGNGLAVYLLQKMENEISRRNIKTAYTIARATSYSINIIFAKIGYKYSGTLLNNTNISGNLESMNVWHRKLSHRSYNDMCDK
jgi:beta-lysine N6-acetyltransferase